MCFGAKWLGKKAKMYSIDDYEGFTPLVNHKKDGSILITPFDDYDIMLEMRDILDEADIVVGWNSKRFDVKKVQARMIALGIKPPSPFKQIDVMQEKKKVAASNYNHLDETGEEWGTGRKMETDGWKLWRACLEGDQKAWNKMKRYCLQDVNLTERNYKHLLPWMATHPNLNAYSGERKACSGCGRKNTFIWRGYTQPTNAGFRRRRYVCEPTKGGCGKWCSGEAMKRDPDEKLIIVK
jgi:hypothetical protein